MDRERANITLHGKDYVIVSRDEYDRLATRAKAADLPALPKRDRAGNFPAAEFARAAIARRIIRERAAAGWTQRELARRAGIRFEHLCRIETGKHTPSIGTIAKIDRALKGVRGKSSRLSERT